MSSIAIDFTGLFSALAIGALAALLATPLFWRFTAGLSTFRRAILSVLSALGLSGLAAAILTYTLRDREIAALALGTTLMLQIVALPALIFFTRHSRKG